MKKERIGIGSDHGGWSLQQEIVGTLNACGYRICDYSLPEPLTVDYPDVAGRLAGDIAAGKLRRGILICGTGLGMAIAANKFPGIRATPCYDSFTARLSREHNDSNVLTLGGRITGPELAKEIARVWLVTPFTRGRHARRLAKIANLEHAKENP